MNLRKHPFEAFFEKALAANEEGENRIAEAAFNLANKGYPPKEIEESLTHFMKTLVDEGNRTLAKDAIDEFTDFYGTDEE